MSLRLWWVQNDGMSGHVWLSAGDMLALRDEMEAQGRALLADAQVRPDDVTVERFAEMRLAGQAHQIPVKVPSGRLSSGGADTIRQNHIKIMNSSQVISGWWPGNPQRMDVMDAGDLVGFRFKIDVTANAVLAGYFREEWPVAVEYVKENVLTRVAPTDVYVYAPANSRELANAIYMQLEYGSRVVRPGDAFIACVSACDHTPPPPRSIEATLAEIAYATEQWNRESGTGDASVRAHWRKRDLV